MWQKVNSYVLILGGIIQYKHEADKKSEKELFIILIKFGTLK